MKILKKLTNPKVSLILLLVLTLAFLLFFEFRKQWEEQNGNLLPMALIQKIKDAPAKKSNDPDALNSIKIFHLGGSIIRQEGISKIVVETQGGQVWYTLYDSNFDFRVFLEEIKDKDISEEKRQLISYGTQWEFFKLKPFTFILSPIFQILSACASIFWVIYIWGIRMLDSKKSTLEITDNHKNTTFKDVAGNEEEKEEMQELIDFLKQPRKYLSMGVSIPKGVLLEGPPGTGKTLLAKALAGEAGVPFYAVSGSEFVEMYVGVGASRVRNLFKEAKQNAPCVLFIDEIDVLGCKRSNSSSGGSQEKDQTLNQLLTEMDGFTKSKGIIVVGATNRADMLDTALLRPGRFDRQILVSLPDKKARQDILKLYSQNKKIADNVDFHQLAKQTPGMSGAQLAAVLNEASILTIRAKKNVITMDEFQEAIDRVLMGPAKKSRKYTEKEKRETAYHEAGHAVISIKLQDAPKLQKITIIPRGKAGGYILFMQEEELFFESKKRLQARIVCSLGARAAEEMMFGDENISDGCYDDLKKATKVACLMVTKYGMSDLGLMQDSEFADKKAINDTMKEIMEKSYQQAQTIIKENKDLLDKIATKLLEQDTITHEEIEKLV